MKQFIFTIIGIIITFNLSKSIFNYKKQYLKNKKRFTWDYCE